MSGNARAGRPRAPEFFCTGVRKIEPVGGDCIRVYCSIERDGEWEDRVTITIPMTAAMKSARFVMQSIAEIHNDMELLLHESDCPLVHN